MNSTTKITKTKNKLTEIIQPNNTEFQPDNIEFQPNNIESNNESKKPFSLISMLTIILAGLFLLLALITTIIWKTTKQQQDAIESQKTSINKLSSIQAEHQQKFETLTEDLQEQLTRIVSNQQKMNANSNLTSISSEQSSGKGKIKFKPENADKFLKFEQLIGFKGEIDASKGFLDYLNNPSKYQNIGDVDVPVGILMHGTAGTGKTTLARSLAKESGLPFFEVASSTFSQKYKGVAVELVQDLFRTARAEAKRNKKGAIVFLDECETIFADLSTIENGSELANVVNQFKTEMTSSENDKNHPIFIIGATNHYHKVDEAIKSRFTYNIEVKTGNFEERKKYLEFMINRRKNPYSEEAKHYLIEDINNALNTIGNYNDMLRANRTLENLLKTTVNIFAQNRDKTEPIRNEINVEDLQKAFQLNITQNSKLLPKNTYQPKPTTSSQQPNNQQPGSQQPNNQQPGSQQPNNQQPGSQSTGSTETKKPE